MHGFALAFLGLTFAAYTLELPKDVYENPTRQFLIPYRFEPNCRRDEIEKIRLFVSEDQGKTWKHQKDYEPRDKLMSFTAPRDGLYWFAVQVVLKNGDSEPAKADDLVPGMKVYVNSKGRAPRSAKYYEEVECKVEQLRRTFEQLQKIIKQLESDR